MFGFLEKEYHPRRPLVLQFETDTTWGDNNAVWFMEGQTFPKMYGRGGVIFSTPTQMKVAGRKSVSIGAQELTDVPARLADLDKMKIDKQVVYPTLFLTTTADDVDLEAALLRAYNSFMADACAKSGGRIRFGALLPVRDPVESVKELRRAKSLGAASAMVLGIAWDRSLRDKKMYPIYEEAEKLDIPLCVHFGWGAPALTGLFEWQESFVSAALPVMMGFFSLMSSGVLETFPRLRLAFLESGSEWVPYLVHQLKRGKKVRRDPLEYMREGRVFIGCESDEDINYLVQFVGEDALVAASDYPHTDPSQEETLVESFMGREEIPLRIREKILSHNPKRLYHL
jgi:predicted TIM-barrel fold metal-dependent hydrolase